MTLKYIATSNESLYNILIANDAITKLVNVNVSVKKKKLHLLF